MKKYPFSLLFIFLIGASCQQENNENTSSTEETTDNRTAVVAGNPVLHSMNESLTMSAVTTYTSKENIRATTTGYVQNSNLQQGISVTIDQQVMILKTKEAAALGEEILKDSSINIKGEVPIFSKQAGIITQVFFQNGDYVVDGDILAELTKPSSLAVKLYVPYEYNKEVKLQKRVSVRLPDGEMLNGVVKQLLPSEDIPSQTTPYLVTVSPYRFLPENLNLTVSIITQNHKDALAVPKEAVQSNEEQTRFWVMKIINDSLAIQHPVELGMRTDYLIELRNSKLTIADRIIVQGAYGLPDTVAINLVNEL